LFAGALAFMIIFSVSFPRFLAYGPGLIGLISAAFYSSMMGQKLSLSRPAFLIAGITLLLAGMSSLWAIDAGEALERTVKMAFILLPGVLLFSVAKSLPENVTRQYLWIIAAAAVLGSLVVTADIFLDFPLHKLTRGIAAGEQVSDAVANRSVVVMLLVMVPSAFFVYDRLRQENKKPVSLYVFLYAALFIPMLAITDSQTAQAGMIVALLFFVAFPYNRRWAWLSLKAVIIAVLIATPWIAIWMYNNLAEHIERGWLVKEASILLRMEIWDFVSRQALQNPFYGFGIEATKAVESFDTTMRFWPSDHVLHPHNFAIQLWIEFGITGVLCAGALCFYIIHVIQKYMLSTTVRFMLPAFMIWLSVAATGYGMWQGWWLGLSFLMLTLGALSGKHLPVSSPQKRGSG